MPIVRILSISGSLAFLCLCLCLSSCEENPPFAIDFTIYKDTTFVTTPETPQAKTVLIEEFTGVRCRNCPAGHEKTRQILEENPNRVVAAIIHAGYFADPYPQSSQVFATEETEDIHNLLGVIANPAAAIDRQWFTGEDKIPVDNKNAWASRVAEQLSKTAPLNLSINREYNENTRNATIAVRLAYTQTQTDEQYITAYLIETDIIDAQLMAGENGQQDYIIPDYAHRHIVRDVLTPITGKKVEATRINGTVVITQLEATLPQGWNAEKCSVVAFVHQANGVVQAAEIPLK